MRVLVGPNSATMSDGYLGDQTIQFPASFRAD